nr:hypothetical protein [Tanacetum cinerariifolium]
QSQLNRKKLPSCRNEQKKAKLETKLDRSPGNRDSCSSLKEKKLNRRCGNRYRRKFSLEDEDAIDKGVADKSKKRKSDDVDRDKGPLARLNQSQTSPLLTVPVLVILESSTTPATTIPLLIPPCIPLP